MNDLVEAAPSDASVFAQTSGLLQDAIMSCHDILACECVDLPECEEEKNASFEMGGCIGRGDHSLFSPRAE